MKPTFCTERYVYGAPWMSVCTKIPHGLHMQAGSQNFAVDMVHKVVSVMCFLSFQYCLAWLEWTLSYIEVCSHWESLEPANQIDQGSLYIEWCQGRDQAVGMKSFADLSIVIFSISRSDSSCAGWCLSWCPLAWTGIHCILEEGQRQCITPSKPKHGASTEVNLSFLNAVSIADWESHATVIWPPCIWKNSQSFINVNMEEYIPASSLR